MPLFANACCVDTYADDTTMHVAHTDKEIIEHKLQTGANSFKHWCNANKMHINIDKTTIITIATRQNLSIIESLEIHSDNELIQTVQNQKLLGVIIDKTLSLDKQIDSVCLNISRRITLLKLLSKYVDKTSLI